ncbi:MAG: CPBP family intramembrane metalloprotease [Leptospira sp.]|nr:CPBP family intramembrane metalloprotease [Leptospira sp.]
MQKSNSISILLPHLGLIIFGQIILILLVQFTIQFVILQDRLPADQIEGKTFEELGELQKTIASEFEKDLREDPGKIGKRYYELVFTERNGILFWSNLLWIIAFILPGWYILGKRMEIPISKLEDPLQVPIIGKGILAGIGVFFAVSMVGIILNLMDWKPKNNEFQEMLFINLKGNANLLAWSIYSVGLITGIIEEWFFRGMLLKHFVSKGLIREGWILTSVLFGALHYSPEASLIIPFLLTGVGFLFGYLYLKFNNIWVPIFAHATYNSIGLVAAYFMGDMVV